ncbi:MAG: Tfp pilus assembly protein FimT/FimU [Candidatus Methylacidiphilales bacterium]
MGIPHPTMKATSLIPRTSRTAAQFFGACSTLAAAVHRKSRASRKGFSLIEMMTVVAVISVMLSLSGPSLMSVMTGRSISLGLNMVSSMTAQARQAALSGGQPVALVITEADATNSGSTQALILLAATGTDSTGTMQWKAKCMWNQLPRNVLVEAFVRNGSPSFFNQTGTDTPLSGPLPVLMNNNTITKYSYIVFFPDGSVSAPTSGPAVTIRNRGKVSTTPDFTLVVQTDSGRAKVIAN